MDDLSAKLAEILNDPKAMNEVRAMAESLLGEAPTAPQPQVQVQPQPQPPQPQAPISDLASLLPAGGLDMSQMAGLMKIMNALKGSGNDSRAQLLMALKPHLSEPRREKVDTAVKLLKLIEALPLLKESGILNF